MISTEQGKLTPCHAPRIPCVCVQHMYPPCHFGHIFCSLTTLLTHLQIFINGDSDAYYRSVAMLQGNQLRSLVQRSLDRCALNHPAPSHHPTQLHHVSPCTALLCTPACTFISDHELWDFKKILKTRYKKKTILNLYMSSSVVFSSSINRLTCAPHPCPLALPAAMWHSLPSTCLLRRWTPSRTRCHGTRSLCLYWTWWRWMVGVTGPDGEETVHVKAYGDEQG